MDNNHKQADETNKPINFKCAVDTGFTEWLAHELGQRWHLDAHEINEAILRGLDMPHSPRRHNGNLLLVNSGEGQSLESNKASVVASGAPQTPAGTNARVPLVISQIYGTWR